MIQDFSRVRNLKIGVVQAGLHITDGTGKEDDSGSKDYDSKGHSRKGD